MISYDPVKVLARFAKRHSINFSLLSDPNSNAIRAFDVRNKDFPPKSYGYGVARPTIFIIDSNGVVTKRFSESDYQKRPSIDDVLNALD